MGKKRFNIKKAAHTDNRRDELNLHDLNCAAGSQSEEEDDQPLKEYLALENEGKTLIKVNTGKKFTARKCHAHLGLVCWIGSDGLCYGSYLKEYISGADDFDWNE
ncbi:MAG: hypothetical protein LBJ95_00610 [Oscillospiraceae bacterium]|nr:hypothetical protein [Oscillospiraceae bacterium]